MKATRSILVAAAALAFLATASGSVPHVASGAPLSAAALHAALAHLTGSSSELRETLIEARGIQVGTRERIVTLEFDAGVSAQSAELDTIAVDPATEALEAAGVVAGQVASSEALNVLFAALATDATNFDAFLALLLEDHARLKERVETLEGIAEVEPPEDVGMQPFDAPTTTVPHEFVAGALMRASEMNANFDAISSAMSITAAVTDTLTAALTALVERVAVLETALAPIPRFTWYIGTHVRQASTTTSVAFHFHYAGTFEPFTIGLSGPDGYTNSWEITHDHTIGISTWLGRQPSGVFVATATFGGTSFELPIEYDAIRSISMPNLALEDATANRVEVTLDRVEGAEFYQILFEAMDGSVYRYANLLQFSEERRTVTFDDLTLDPDAPHRIRAWLYSVTSYPSVDLEPQQVDTSFEILGPFVPSEVP